VRRLLGLQAVLSIGFCGPVHDVRSWTFDLDPGGVDPVLKIPRLQDAYFARFSNYSKGITVPAIVDVPTGQVITNDFAQMTLDLSIQWRQYHREGAPELYPEPLRAEIDEVLSASTQRSITVFVDAVSPGRRRPTTGRMTGYSPHLTGFPKG
jgi:putative glutathione S-transferase